jgi:hypothetical protein
MQKDPPVPGFVQILSVSPDLWGFSQGPGNLHSILTQKRRATTECGAIGFVTLGRAIA